MRGLSLFFLALFTGMIMAPSAIVAEFLMERSRIMKELCVQRMVPEAQRTCHGECCLKKRLDTASQRSRDMPTELRALRIGDLLANEGTPVITPEVEAESPSWAIITERTLAGYLDVDAPVPWC